MTIMSVNEVLSRTDWELLAVQKQSLLALPETELITGLINWLDALQDAAEAEGFPVVFLLEEDATS